MSMCSAKGKTPEKRKTSADYAISKELVSTGIAPTSCRHLKLPGQKKVCIITEHTQTQEKYQESQDLLPSIFLLDEELLLSLGLRGFSSSALDSWFLVK